MDRNSAIGLTLISALLLAYFYFFSPEPQAMEEVKQTTDTVRTKSDQPAVAVPVELPDSVLNSKFGPFSVAMKGENNVFSLENNDIAVSFSSKGGDVQKVNVKKYKTYNKQSLILLDETSSKISTILPTKNGPVDISSLYFIPSGDIVSKGDTSYLTLVAQISGSSSIKKTYKLAKDGYTVGYNLSVNGLEEYLVDQPVVLQWNDKIKHTEKDVEQSRLTSAVNYYDIEGTFEAFNDNSKDPEDRTLDKKIKWLAFKQKFFSASIIYPGTFTKGSLKATIDPMDSSNVKNFEVKLEYPVAAINNKSADFTYFFGPNKYQISEKVTEGFNENVYLGWPVINLVNKYLILPIFNLLEKFISNYGLIIILVVLIIRLILFPLSYRSYISMAKIKVLKPELDEIKSRLGDDMTAIQGEQMKLYQQVGVNPIAGCVPLLLQMPFLLAMFNFFPNAIELRQQPFLWADDLSTYDVIATLPFTIPFYGSHVSLFTILMTASTLLYTYMNNQVQTMQQGPMVAMSYIMPLVFLFILNSLPAGLSFYYFVANIASIGQQYLIKAFVDEKQIREKLEENKKNAPTRKTTGFQKRLADALKAQEEIKAQQAAKKKK
ncbi:MAG: membrane protein insertase YidC [Cytophagales bacterium]|nr:membrane protein insertase YidC [Cytophagales bacterium]